MTTRKKRKSGKKASTSRNKVADALPLRGERDHQTPFSQVLEAADRLSADEQESLIEILHRRLAQAGRFRVRAEIQEARHEFAAGRCRTVLAKELLREIAE